MGREKQSFSISVNLVHRQPADFGLMTKFGPAIARTLRIKKTKQDDAKDNERKLIHVYKKKANKKMLKLGFESGKN